MVESFLHRIKQAKAKAPKKPGAVAVAFVLTFTLLFTGSAIQPADSTETPADLLLRLRDALQGTSMLESPSSLTTSDPTLAGTTETTTSSSTSSSTSTEEPLGTSGIGPDICEAIAQLLQSLGTNQANAAEIPSCDEIQAIIDGLSCDPQQDFLMGTQAETPCDTLLGLVDTIVAEVEACVPPILAPQSTSTSETDAIAEGVCATAFALVDDVLALVLGIVNQCVADVSTEGGRIDANHPCAAVGYVAKVILDALGLVIREATECANSLTTSGQGTISTADPSQNCAYARGQIDNLVPIIIDLVTYVVQESLQCASGLTSGGGAGPSTSDPSQNCAYLGELLGDLAQEASQCASAALAREGSLSTSDPSENCGYVVGAVLELASLLVSEAVQCADELTGPGGGTTSTTDLSQNCAFVAGQTRVVVDLVEAVVALVVAEANQCASGAVSGDGSLSPSDPGANCGYVVRTVLDLADLIVRESTECVSAALSGAGELSTEDLSENCGYVASQVGVAVELVQAVVGLLVDEATQCASGVLAGEGSLSPSDPGANCGYVVEAVLAVAGLVVQEATDCAAALDSTGGSASTDISQICYFVFGTLNNLAAFLLDEALQCAGETDATYGGAVDPDNPSAICRLVFVTANDAVGTVVAVAQLVIAEAMNCVAEASGSGGPLDINDPSSACAAAVSALDEALALAAFVLSEATQCSQQVGATTGGAVNGDDPSSACTLVFALANGVVDDMEELAAFLTTEALECAAAATGPGGPADANDPSSLCAFVAAELAVALEALTNLAGEVNQCVTELSPLQPASGAPLVVGDLSSACAAVRGVMEDALVIAEDVAQEASECVQALQMPASGSSLDANDPSSVCAATATAAQDVLTEANAFADDVGAYAAWCAAGASGLPPGSSSLGWDAAHGQAESACGTVWLDRFIPLVVLCDEADADADGVPAYHLCEATLRIAPREASATLTEGAYAVTQTAPDPADRDPSTPAPWVTALCSTVEPEGDRPHALLGLEVVWFGIDVSDCIDQGLDNPLPFTLPIPVPSGAPQAGPDADGDNVPAYASIPRVTVTIQQDGTIAQEPAAPAQVTIDPDDADATNPQPQPQTVCADAQQDTGDGIFVRAGFVFIFQGEAVGECQDVTIDAGILPFTLNLPNGDVTVGLDGDQDEIPGTADIAMTAFTIEDQASPTLSAAPAEPVTVPLDPDDEDASNPVPVVEETCSLVEPSTGDGVHYRLGARFRFLGTPFGFCEEDTVDVGVLPVTQTVPYGMPVMGPDGDLDTVPRYLDIPLVNITIEDEAGNTTMTPAGSVRVPVDPDDTNCGVPVPGLDCDADRIPDAIEQSICGRPIIEQTINNNSQLLGLCPSPSDYVPPNHQAAVDVPTEVRPGDDADSDDLPTNLTVQTQRILIRPFDAIIVSVSSGPDLIIDVDENDTDPDDPVASTFTLPTPIPFGVSSGDDADLDGFPTNLTVETVFLTVDRRNASQLIGMQPGPSTTQTVDEDDADPNTPALGRFTLPTPVPVDATSGPDADRDAFPATYTIHTALVTFDRRDPFAPLTFGAGPDQAFPIDPDDADPDRPLASVFTVPRPVPVGSTPGTDADRDAFPATYTLHTVIVTFDRREPSDPLTIAPGPDETFDVDPDDTDPENPVTSIITLPAPVPINFVVGEDADGDHVPSTVIVERVNVAFDRRNATEPLTFQPTSDDVQPVDPDDADPTNPIPRIDEACNSVERSTGDGVHYRLGVRFTFRGESFGGCAEDTVDANLLPLTVRVPTGEIMVGPDADADLVPAYVDVARQNITIQDSEVPTTVSEPADPLRVPLDPDEVDPSTPLPSLVEVCDDADRTTADGVHFRLGLRYRHLGTEFGFCTEDTVDAGALPITITVPAGTPTNGPDADGDQLPSYVEVRMMNVTLHDDAELSRTTEPAEPVRVPLDPADTDPSNPGPVLLEACSTVERSTGDGIHYRLGVRYLHLGTEFGACIEDTVDAALLPLTVTVPGGAPTTGPDADGDRVPAYVEVPMVNVTISDDEELTRTTEPADPVHVPIDADDADPNVPVPLQALDSDGDFVLDEAEPTICLVQDRNTDLDGRCVRADGTGQDGAGNNYVPPWSSLP